MFIEFNLLSDKTTDFNHGKMISNEIKWITFILVVEFPKERKNIKP